MWQGIPLIDGHSVGHSISRVKHNTSGTSRGIERENSLDGNVHGRRVEGLEHDLKITKQGKGLKFEKYGTQIKNIICKELELNQRMDKNHYEWKAPDLYKGTGHSLDYKHEGSKWNKMAKKFTITNNNIPINYKCPPQFLALIHTSRRNTRTYSRGI